MSQPPLQQSSITPGQQAHQHPYSSASNGGRAGAPTPPFGSGSLVPPVYGGGGAAGRGGPLPMHQQQQHQQQARPMATQPMAWQPAQPTGGAAGGPFLTSASNAGPLPPGAVVGIPGVPPRGPQTPHNPYGHGPPPPQQAYYNPYQPTPPGPFPEGWQTAYASNQQYSTQHQQQYSTQHQQQQPYGQYNANAGGMIGAVFYPQGPQPQQPPSQMQPSGPPQMQQQQQSFVPPPERKKQTLLITDKHGNPLDLSKVASSSKAKAPVAPLAPAPSDAGVKMRQAALERIQGIDKQKQQQEEESRRKKKEEEEAAAAAAAKRKKEEEEEAAKKEEEEKARLEAEAAAAAQREAEEKARKEAEEQAAKESEERAQREAAEKAVAEAAEKAAAEAAKVLKEAEEALQMTLKSKSGSRIVFTKEMLLKLRTTPGCQERPAGLPDMTIVKVPIQRAGGVDRGGSRVSRRDNRGSGGDDAWKRGNTPPRRQTSKGEKIGGGSGDTWARGQAMPPPPPPPPQPGNKNLKGGRGQASRGPSGGGYFDDGRPVEPLKKTENHWRPQKNTTPLVAAEKQVKSLLNKMTKEKFEVLAQQMMDIKILSYEMLTMMIENVYDKAIDEPSFGEIYADLCVRLSLLSTAKGSQTSPFVHIIESDEEPPTESGEPLDVPSGNNNGASHNTVYRWSNDVSTTDAEIVGPFESEEECRQVALAADQGEITPIQRGDMELELVSLLIRQGMFIKIMKKVDPSPKDEGKNFYTVYFPVSEAEVCGQQLSSIFLSQPEATTDANKFNSFKRSLLNKCEEEFNKQDIYKEWKEEKSSYEKTKLTLSEAARAEKEEELAFRRIRIKKQMLGNVKFIGQLFKKNLLKEKIMRYCIASLLKLEENKEIKSKFPEYTDAGNTDMDAEDHEAICNMFATIGSTIDKPAAKPFMDLCFSKIANLSTDKTLPARSRFMYKDLIELRQNAWVPRRKEEKAKTIDEIRKEFEQEERKQQEISAREALRSGGGVNQSFRSGGGGGGARDSYRQQNSPRGGLAPPSSASRPRGPKAVVETDEEGFTTITSGKTTGVASTTSFRPPKGGPVAPPVTTKQSAFAALDSDDAAMNATAGDKVPQPLSDEQLERHIKTIRSDFVNDGGNIDELLLSMQALEATPNAGLRLVQLNSERMVDCKEQERVAIFKIITILAEKKVIIPDDVKNGLTDGIEFIDSIVLDCPRAYEYFGELLASLLRIGVIDVDWICEQAEKTKVNEDTRAPESLVREIISAFKKGSDASAAKSIFGASAVALSRLLGSEAAWHSMANEML